MYIVELLVLNLYQTFRSPFFKQDNFISITLSYETTFEVHFVFNLT